MAAALRLAARRICGGALERPPQAFLAAVGKHAPRRISNGNGGTSLRRTFSESPQNNLVNNNAAEPATSLAARAEEKKQELLQILRQMDHRHCKTFDMEMENKKLVHLLARSPGPAPYSTGYFLHNHWLKSTVGASLGLLALIYVEAEYVIPTIDGICEMVKA